MLLPQVYRAAELGYIDINRVSVAGHSYGGYRATALVSSHEGLAGDLWLEVRRAGSFGCANSRRWEAFEATVHDEFVHIEEPSDVRIITFLRRRRAK